MAYFLGIDNGGTVTKAVLFTERGREVAGASVKVPLLTPQTGYTERDMETLWDANCEAIRAVLSRAGVEAAQVAGIACTGHGKGLYLWGKDDKPAYNGIVSTDARAFEYAQRWEADGTAEAAFEKTCQRVLACQPVSLLRWMKEHEPQVYANIRWIFSVKDYIRFRLTGEAYAEETDISGTNLLNLKEKRYDEELLALFGIGEVYGALPPLRNAVDFCGAVTQEAAQRTGLCAGTPVAGGMFDIDACAVAANVIDERNICVIAGTWSINEYISRTPVLNKSIMMNSLYCVDGYYLIEECSPTSAGNHEWFMDMFLEGETQKAKAQGISAYERVNALADGVAPGEQNIIFLPYLFGSNYNPRAKACLIGMDSHHTRAQIIRAVYEGIAFCHKVHVDQLLKNREKPAAVRLAGGVANAPGWVRIFADVFQLPIEIVEAKELGTLGCAMAAAVAAGTYANLAEASKNMVAIRERVEPNPANAAAYEAKFALYKKASAALDSLWSEF